MAILSSDGTYVTVEKGDTLWSIAEKYLGSGSKYKTLAAISKNNITDPNLIYVGQKIYLSSKGSSTSSSTADTNKPTVTQFGELASSEGTLFATWNWVKENQTESYKIAWAYTTIDGVEFIDLSSNTVDTEYYAASRKSTYNIPSGAVKVTFRVKPISKNKSSKSDKKHWTAEWSDLKTFTVGTPLETLSSPSIEAEDLKITAELDNLDTIATHVQFRLFKDNKTYKTTKAIAINTTAKNVSYVWSAVEPGSEYRVSCRAVKGSLYGEWSALSSEVVTKPPTPKTAPTCKATDATTVNLQWESVKSATGYEIEYTTKKEYFDTSSNTTKVNGIESTSWTITNMESGQEYFFRVRAINDSSDESEWSPIVSIVLGKVPTAPTTWSSTTTAIVGETVTLYWVHNSQDGSSETYADLEIYVDDVKETHTIKKSTEENEKDKTAFYQFDTSSYSEGAQIRWRVRTAGATNEYGDWSVERTVDIYAQPTLTLSVVEATIAEDGTVSTGDDITEITNFPFVVKALPGPATQTPIGYHLSVLSNEIYETVDRVGNEITINKDEEVYSKFFDTMQDLTVLMSAGNIDLANNISYTVQCTVTMNSGLTVTESLVLPVTWAETMYVPNAEISVDTDTYTAYIRPYCENLTISYRQVNYTFGTYEKTDTVLTEVWSEEPPVGVTTTGEQVYFGVDADGNEVYYCQVEERSLVENISLAVYRREFDGTFTELATGLDNSKNVTITDPHPSLDYARYRIVATSKDTGAVGYYDLPGYPVEGKAIIIQWDEEWTRFETDVDGVMSQPPWSGSLLKLPYNIDVSDKRAPDVALIEYVGRAHPVSYYGTQLGESATWNTVIEKSDKETLYALRRLSIWLDDVYVREPSGSGYWAHVVVTFGQKHKDMTIPVTLDVTRVEGGI